MRERLPLDWYTAEKLMASARDKSKGKPLDNNTRLYEEGYPGQEHLAHSVWRYVVQLYGHDIMYIHRGYFIVMDADIPSSTTKRRLNRLMPIGKIAQRNWEWFIEELPHGEVHKFHDVMRIDYDGYVQLYGDEE